MNTALIGETAAKMMDGLGDRDGQVVAVALVAVIEGEEDTYTRAEFSSDRFYEQLGLLHVGIRVAEDGSPPDDD